jgi:hypothetical protein
MQIPKGVSMTKTEGDICAGSLSQATALHDPTMQRIFPDEESTSLI